MKILQATRLWIALACFGAAAAQVVAQAASPVIGAPAERSQDSNYLLTIRDQISISVFDEPDLSVTQRIDGNGQVRLALLGTYRVAGMSIRQAEETIQQAYVRERFLANPMVTITVMDYAPKEISVLGEVNNPGRLSLPIELNSMDIVEVISQVGGFTNLALANSVRVTRRTESGQEIIFTVNVDSLISGRGRRGEPASRVAILPGDVVWVPERRW
jgi:protein involved in polysaccharide export with SLBB domain